MATIQRTQKRLIGQKLTTNFREAVTIETTDMCFSKKGEVCIKNKYVGVNASDVNMTKGRYFKDAKIPFGIGFEGIGEIVDVGDEVENFTINQSVAYLNSNYNSYAEYVCVSASEVFAVPEVKPDYLALLVCGLTASIGLDENARIIAGETVLITAAAGGTGHLAVQWAKAADCHVIGTCSSDEKEIILKELGCDRVINYRKEDIDEVLTKEYKDGVNVIWETIGGKVFETCLKHLSRKGRLIVAGGTSGYKSKDKNAIPKVDLSHLPGQLLMKSAAVQGFILFHYTNCYATYFKRMTASLESGNLRAVIDDGRGSVEGEFCGLEGIIRGVEYLHSGKNIGKVVARIY